MSKIIKNLKYKLVVGYTVAIALAAIFLLCFSFDWLFFIVSLIWGISFLRLEDGNVPIKNTKVVKMWCIFCFGLSGIIMQALQIGESHSEGVIAAGIVALFLYCFVPMFSYYLKYNDELWGHDVDDARSVKTKFNSFVGSLFLLLFVIVISFFVDIGVFSQNEDKELTKQLKTEQFVPVKKISEEMYKGSTIYILEAKGQRFMVQPIEYPEVRDINPKSQVRVIFDKHNTFYQMKCVKEIEFKN